MSTIPDLKMVPPVTEARKLRNAHWNRRDNPLFPVNPYTVANSLGIETLRAKLDIDVAGFIIGEDGKSTRIMVNRDDRHSSQRFTVSHILGHVVCCGPGKIGFVEYRDKLSSDTSEYREAWCNQFADELLMPSNILRKWWIEGRPPEEMADTLDVTLNNLARRITDLKLMP